MIKILTVMLSGGPAQAQFRHTVRGWKCVKADFAIHYFEIMPTETIKLLLDRNGWAYEWQAGPDEVRNPTVPRS